MGFRDPAPAEVTATVTGNVTTLAGSQTTPAGATAWGEPILDVTLNAAGASGWFLCTSRQGLFVTIYANNVDQRITVEFSDTSGGFVRHSVEYHFRANQVGRFYLPVRSDWCRVVAAHVSAGGVTGIVVNATDRGFTPATYVAPGEETMVHTGFVTIAAGASRVDYFSGPFTGPALLSFYTDCTAGLAFLYIVGRTYDTAVQKSFVIHCNDKAKSLLLPVHLPPLILRTEMYNQGAAVFNFHVALVPAGPR